MTKEGAKFMDVDRAAFQEATLSVYDKYADEYGDFVNNLREAAAAAAQ
jgi:TRAP-type C4-dicarboxylate transport system substrate-binding protein